MLESRSEDAPVKPFMTVETIETVETVKIVETDDLKKYRFFTHLFTLLHHTLLMWSQNFILSIRIFE